MPKTAVETAVCNICGAEVREGSVFCYNCGGSVTKAEEPAATPAPIEPKANGIAAPVGQRPTQRQADRHKVRAANRQPTEIVWEPRNGVSWVFVIASLVFVILALAVVIAAFYLR